MCTRACASDWSNRTLRYYWISKLERQVTMLPQQNSQVIIKYPFCSFAHNSVILLK